MPPRRLDPVDAACVRPGEWPNRRFDGIALPGSNSLRNCSEVTVPSRHLSPQTRLRIRRDGEPLAILHSERLSERHVAVRGATPVLFGPADHP
jgi:hypothetical protein